MTVRGASRPLTAAVDVTEVADRALDLAGHIGGAGVDADVHVAMRSCGQTLFTGSTIRQDVTRRDLRVQVRVAFDGRWARVTGHGTDAASLTDLVRSAVDGARGRPPDPGYPGMAPATPTAATGNWDEPTAAATQHERAKVVRDFVAALHRLDAVGAVETAAEQAAYTNSAGQRLHARRTWAILDGLARTSTSDGVARGAAVRLSDLAGAEAGAVASAAARAAEEPSHLDAGTYDVVLAPSCVARLLRMLARYGFNGWYVLSGQSFVERGARQFDPSIQLWDDATDPLSTSLPYDAEGTTRRRVDLVVNGEARAVLHDRRTAAAAGARSTGHALPDGERLGPYPSDLRLGTGDGGGTDDLLGRIGRGLLLTDLSPLEVADPRTVLVTGFSRHAAWLVEDGEAVRPVRVFRFTVRCAEAFRTGRVVAIGSSAGALFDRRGGGLCVTPGVALTGWHVDGSA